MAAGCAGAASAGRAEGAAGTGAGAVPGASGVGNGVGVGAGFRGFASACLCGTGFGATLLGGGSWRTTLGGGVGTGVGTMGAGRGGRINATSTGLGSTVGRSVLVASCSTASAAVMCNAIAMSRAIAVRDRIMRRCRTIAACRRCRPRSGPCSGPYAGCGPACWRLVSCRPCACVQWPGDGTCLGVPGEADGAPAQPTAGLRKPSTSSMSYRPVFLSARNRTARRLPWA